MTAAGNGRTPGNVKICGIRTKETIRAISGLDVDYIGFVFAPSKRQVTVAQAAELIQALHETGCRARTVGVFVRPSLQELDTVLAIAPLDAIQLHGGEDPATLREIKSRYPVTVIAVLPVTPTENGANAGESSTSPEQSAARQLEPYEGVADVILLDTHDPVTGGGTGTPFAWDRIPPYRAWCAAQGIPLWVAGGLNPDNVGGLIADYAPEGVDVSSGVETDGTKDIAKIQAFVERVKSSHVQRT